MKKIIAFLMCCILVALTVDAQTITLKTGNNYVAGTVQVSETTPTQVLQINNWFDCPMTFDAVFSFECDSTLDTVRVTESYRSFTMLPWVENRDTVYKAVSDDPIKTWTQSSNVKARYWKYTFYGGDGDDFDLVVPYQIKYWRPSGY